LGFQNFIDYVENNNIKASIGLIGNSLEVNNEQYLQYIKNISLDGSFEIWNHGYNHKLTGTNENGETYHEFWNTTYDYQKDHLEKTQELALEKLGITLRAFGAPGNNHDSITLDIINENDEIKLWFYGNPESDKIVLERHYNIEFSSQYPDYEEFVNNYPANEEYLALQIHPKAWDNEGFNQFELIIEFLMTQKVAFITPYEFYRLSER
jgi:peptidoglycan/xylan/chitin deacetylase (PgdA/CDA1 family)